MTAINHHTSDALLAAYASGNLAQPFALVVAAHVSMCIECRAALLAHQTVGGAVMEAGAQAACSGGLKASILDRLDDEPVPEITYARSSIFPSPVMAALKGKPPRWKSLGMGVRQSILSADDTGSVRLLYIPAGRAMPDHSHSGMELTLVLQGSFSDETGRFGVGDVEVAFDDLEHTPTANVGPACICLAAADAPLRFTSLIPRMLQPIFRI